MRTAVKILYDDGTVQDIAAPGPDPVPPVAPLSNQSRFRVNLDFPNSSSTCYAFADALKSARPLGLHTTPDSRIVFAEQPADAATAGTYKLYKDGAFVRDVVVAAGQAQLDLQTGPGNFELIRPGCKRGDLFTPQFLEQLKPFGGFRFMDWGQANGNKIVMWADRPTLDGETWERPGFGVPLEVMIALCNQTGKDAWFCLPHAAHDTYLQNFARLVQDTLRPDVNCYVEYGNELWNSAGVFAIARSYILGKVREIKAAADAAGTKTIYHEPDTGNWNETNAMHRWAANRTVELGNILGSRFRMVLSNQNGYSPAGHWFRHQLEFIQRVHGNPSEHLYAIASAPYGGISDPDPKPEMRAGIKAQADRFAVKYSAYEGGYHNESGGQAMLDKHVAPEAFDATVKYANNMFDSGIGEFYWFVGSSDHRIVPVKKPDGTISLDKVRCWGLARGTHDMTSPKYLAAVKVAGERQQ